MKTERTATTRRRPGPAQALMLTLLVSPPGCGQQELAPPCTSGSADSTCDTATSALQPATPMEAAPSVPAVPPPLPAPSVCAQLKAAETGSTFTLSSSYLRLAAAGTEAALVYARSSRCGRDLPWTIMLQRLSSSGALQGMPIELATVNGPGKNEPPPTTLATDGAVFMACWQNNTAGASSVACSTIPVGSSVPTPAPFTDAGESPVLSYGHGSFVLRYHRDQPALQRLSATGAAVGDAVLFGQQHVSVSGVSAVIPSRNGFLFGARLASSSPASLQLLDKELRPVSEQTVSHDTAGLLSIADEGALVYNSPQLDGYSLRFTPISADGIPGTESVVDPTAAASLSPLSFRAAAVHDKLGLLIANRDPATSRERLQLTALGRNGVRSGPPIDLGAVAEKTTFTVESFDITPVSDGFLAARMGATTSSELTITHLSCLDSKSP